MTGTRIMDETLIALIGADDEEAVYRVIVDTVHGLLPGSFVVSTRLLPESSTFAVTHTAGLDRYLDPIRSVVGFDPTGIKYALDDLPPKDLATYRSGRLEPVDGGLYGLALGRIPAVACAAVERLLGVRSVYVIGYAWGELHYGTLSLGVRSDTLELKETLETLVHHATIAIRRLRAEDELRTKQAELDAFFTQSLDLLCIADVHGSFRRLNREWERTLGYPLESLEGHRFLDLVHPDDVAATLGAVDRLAKGLPETRFVNRYRTASGSYRWLEWRAFPRGELIYAAARDLTERIEAEQALRESETRFRLMADNAADVIWLMDPASGRFTYVSPSAERLRGYTPAEILAQPVEAALTPESYRQVMRDLPARTAAFQAGEGAVTHVDEVDQPRRDGSIVQTEVTSSFITDAEGRIVQILGTSRDITERRQAEAEIRALNESLEARVAKRTAQLEEAVAELEAFSYSVSHDLRAPLRAINGYATILVQDHGDSIGDDGVGLCDRIVDNTRRMGQLIDDLLAFARLGRTTLSVEAVDMRALVDEVLAEVRDKGLVQLDIGPLAPAEGDPVLLRQVWLNLIDNAVKFSAGRATARVRVGCREEPGELVYTVRDNGVGFDMQYVDKLFEVFERLHAGSYRGSGIGLAIVRRIVEAHGGRVWAEGEPDAGATFFFALPASGPAAAPPD